MLNVFFPQDCCEFHPMGWLGRHRCPEKHAATAAPHRDTLALGAGEFGASVRFLCQENHGLFFIGEWCILGEKMDISLTWSGESFKCALVPTKGNETTELLIGLPVLKLRHGWRDLWLNRKNHLKPFEVLCCKALNLFEGLRTLYHRVHRHSEEPLKSFVPVLFCKHLCEQI